MDLLDHTANSISNLYRNYCYLFSEVFTFWPILIETTVTIVKVANDNTLRCLKGRGCGSVGRAVASGSRDSQFESSPWQILFAINRIEKTEIKKKRPIFS